MSCMHFHSLYQSLNGIDLFFLEIGLPALWADPGRDFVQADMDPSLANVEWSDAFAHFRLTINSIHFFLLVLKSLSHWSSPGT